MVKKRDDDGQRNGLSFVYNLHSNDSRGREGLATCSVHNFFLFLIFFLQNQAFIKFALCLTSISLQVQFISLSHPPPIADNDELLSETFRAVIV